MFKKLFITGFALASSFSVLAGIPKDTKKNVDKGIDFSVEVISPTEMDRNYDELLDLWMTETNGAIDCDYDAQAAIYFTDSVYINRLYALPTKMELAFNPIVKRFIEMYADRRRNQVSYMLGKGAYYFPLFEEELDKEGLPLELKYLPVIESALNPVAKSRAGATGLWQFMTGTGKMYKLEINSLVDERRDPYKATMAAVQYLKDMYRVYGDWNLVIAAYNCGPGNVNKAIRRSGGKRDYWEIYQYLPKETRGYVPAFIAATYIMSYHQEHNICPVESDLPMLVDTLNVNRLVHLQQIADVINVPLEQIRTLNPQFKDDIIPGEHREYALKLPISGLTAFIANQDTIYTHRAEELLTHKRIRDVASGSNVASGGGSATHKVKRGDTLGAIARRYGVSIAQIRKWNGMSSDKLSVGKSLKVSAYIAPVKQDVQASPAVSQPVVEKLKSELVADNGILKRSTTVTQKVASSYKVEKGDTWGTIASKNGATVAQVKRWNGAKTRLFAGSNVKIYKTETVEQLAEVAKLQKPIIGVNTARISDFLETYAESFEAAELNPITLGLNLDMPVRKEVSLPKELRQEDFVYHKLVYGETMSQIAERYNVTVKDILNWNNLTNNLDAKVSSLMIMLPKTKGQIAKQHKVPSSGATAQL